MPNFDIINTRNGKEMQKRLSKSYSKELKEQVTKECIETNNSRAVSRHPRQEY